MADQTARYERVRQETAISRRRLLAFGAALAAIPSGSRLSYGSARRSATFAADPFSLGVASGEPTSKGVVLWTRLAPDPLVPGGGLPAESFEVDWEIASDDAMKQIVRKGKALATPQLGHSVHVEVNGLAPDRWYWYRFRAGGAESRVGRTRTLPPASSDPDALRFAFASCQHYEHGYYTAYEHMAKDELDLIIHLGDYIYEYEGKENLVRKHVGREIATLEDYRIRHAQYKLDANLQAAHGHCPWLVTWDDHEFDNNYASHISEEKGIDPAEFLRRRANAYQAYYEMMPLRRSTIPQGAHMRLFRKTAFGRLAEIFVLDTRQYRTDQPNGDRASELNDAALDPKNTLLGTPQKDWLKASLIESEGTWNILAQQVMMGMADISAGEPKRYSMDQWPGCSHERMELVSFLEDRRVPNPVVLTGDIHSNWVNDLRVDDRKPELPVVATEFVGTSISSGGNGQKEPKNQAALLAENPFVRFHNTQRGYVRCLVTPDHWKSDYVVVENVTKPGEPAVLRAAFAIESGKAGAQPA